MPEKSSPAEAGVFAATLAAAALIAQQVAGKAARDAFFLTRFSVHALPTAMLAAAGLSLLATLAASRALVKFAPARVVPALLGGNALLFAVEALLAPSQPRPIAAVLYFHTSTLGATVISAFWSLVNERYDPYTAKRVIARITSGAVLGGVAGGLLAWRVGPALGVSVMLALLAAVNLVGAAGVVRLARRAIGAPAAAGPRVAEPTTPQGKVPYLRVLALLVALGAVTEALIDYVLKARAAARLTDGAELISFFAAFHMATAVVAFVLQSTVSRRALAVLGLAGTVALLPGSVAGAGVVALLAPVLWSAALLRGLQVSLGNSLYRSAYELLYTPLSPLRKRAAKTLIDVGMDRLGGAIGSGLIILAVALAPRGAQLALIGAATITAVAAVLLTGPLQRGYVATLAHSLQTGTLALDDRTAIDATTRRTLADSTMALDRDQLLREIERLRTSAVDAAPVHATAPEAPPPTLVEDIAALRGPSAGHRLAALRDGGPLDPLLVGHVVPLLADDALARDATLALRTVVDRAAGQLVDALLDPALPAAARRRLPRVLRICTAQRAVDGLLLGLAVDDFEVRRQCGLALLRLRERAAELRMDRGTVMAAVLREIRAGDDGAGSAPSVSPEGDADGDGMPFTATAERPVGALLESVFVLLALVLDRDPLQLSYRALASRNDALRGTALEYLDNVLPTEVRDPLWPLLGAVPPTAKPRPQQQLVDELIRSISGRSH